MIEGDGGNPSGQTRSVERRYFLLGWNADRKTAPMKVWLNEEKLRQNFPADENKPFQGLIFSEVPRVSFDRRGHRGVPLDAYPILLGIWLVSDRLKHLFERIDPNSFVFEHAEVDYGNFEKPGSDYWFCDIPLLLDCVDEGRSQIEYQKNTPFKNYLHLATVEMLPKAVGKAHAFRLKYAPLKQIVDDVLASALENENIVGFKLSEIRRASAEN